MTIRSLVGDCAIQEVGCITQGHGAENSHEAYGNNHYSNNDKGFKSKFVDETCAEDDNNDDTRPYYEGNYIVVAPW